MNRLTGKVAVVVGASSGMGRRVAEVMAEEGARVVATARSSDAVDEVVEGIRAAGGEATAALVDIAEEGQIAALIETTVTTYGGVDVLVCNAAALDADVGGVDFVHDVGTIPTDVWDRTFQVNVRGTMLCIKHALPSMLERGGGSIIVVSAVASGRGIPFLSAFAAANASREALVRHVAAAYGKRGIRCNAIAPGLIVNTERARRPQEFIERFMRNVPSRDHGSTDDIAQAMVFLASDESPFVQGQVLNVDGGLSAVSPTFADESEMGPGRLEG